MSTSHITQIIREISKPMYQPFPPEERMKTAVDMIRWNYRPERRKQAAHALMMAMAKEGR